jgi:hypothetical protein
MPFIAARLIGYQSGAFTTFSNSGLNTLNQIASNTFIDTPNFPSIVYRYWAYFAGNGQTTNARLGHWSAATGALQGKSPQFTAPSGTLSTGGQTLNSLPSDGSNLIMPSNFAIIAGFWRDASKSSVWSALGSGKFIQLTNTSGDIGTDAGGSFCTGVGCGDIQAYTQLCGGDMKAITNRFPCFYAKKK